MKNSLSTKIKKSIIENSYKAGACHIGSALSCSDILIDIYNKLKKDDIFIFSKASGVCAFYSLLAEKGFIPHNKVAFYLKKYPLPNKKVPGVTWSGGSLGTGLPVACGMALADRKRNVYTLLGDGDCQEGTFYESLLFARQHKLINLKIYIDRNGLQALGNTEDVLGLDKALEVMRDIFPFKVIKTIKGAGVPLIAEMGYKNHYYNLTKDDYKRAILELDKR
jgi:transketolase